MARLRVIAGVSCTVPRLTCPLVALGAAEPGVGTGPGVGVGAGAGAGAGAGGGGDPSGVTPPGEILAGEALPGNNMVSISKSRADGGKTTVEVAKAVCGVHITRQRPITTPIAVSKSTKPAVTLSWPPPERSASKESEAPTTCPRRMTSQNAPTSPSRQPKYKARQS